MADKSIEQLNSAEKIYATDLFVLQQSGQAKKLTGQVLLNWLTAAADGHGGIQSIEKLSTNVLIDTYRITLADTTIFDFVVTNGRGITGIVKTATSGLVDTYTISYNDGATGTFTVTNGAKGDKGDNAYIWIKYASQEPTDASHSMGDIPDNWIGIYSGNLASAPSDWQQYQWFEIKGAKGDTGAPATLYSQSVTYQVGDSGSIIPSGSWGSSVPVVPQGKYLWTRTEVRFNTGDPIVFYSVARMGIDGSGSVSSVSGVSPDETGNVTLTAADVGALPSSGGDMTGAINMNGQPVSGLNPPTEDTQAANKGYVDTAVRKAAPRNLLDNSDFRNPVNQRGATIYSGNSVYTIDRWNVNGNVDALTVSDGYITVSAKSGTNGLFRQYLVSSLLFGKTLTLAVKVKDGDLHIISGTYPSSNPEAEQTVATINTANISLFISAQTTRAAIQIRVNSGATVNLEWAALYEGEYTAETLPEYQPKGYGAELQECQRYFRKVAGIVQGYGTTMNAGTGGYISVPVSLPMRVNPSILVEILGYFRANGTSYSVESITFHGMYTNSVELNVKTNSTAVPTGHLAVLINTAFTLSADL